ncbi:hypothetical protein JCM6882_002386 [Rhodosporidiobolus microsporus]
MYSWQSSLQSRKLSYNRPTTARTAQNELRWARDEDESRWGRRETEANGYEDRWEGSRGFEITSDDRLRPRALADGRWERAAPLGDEKERRDTPPPPLTLFKSQGVPKGVYLRRGNPPPELVVYAYRIVLPYRALGSSLIGTGGETQLHILRTAGLVRFSVESQWCRVADLVGSRSSIHRGLQLVSDVVKQQGHYWRFDFAAYDERNLELLPDVWLEDRYADTAQLEDDACRASSLGEQLPPSLHPPTHRSSSTSPQHDGRLDPSATLDAPPISFSSLYLPDGDDLDPGASPRLGREDRSGEPQRRRPSNDDGERSSRHKRRGARSPSIESQSSRSPSFDCYGDEHPRHPRPRRPSQFLDDEDEECAARASSERTMGRRDKMNGRGGEKKRRRREGDERGRGEEQKREEPPPLAVAFPIPLPSAHRFLHPSTAVFFIEENTNSALTLVSQRETSRLQIIAPSWDALEEAIELVERTVGIDEKGWKVPRADGGEGLEASVPMAGVVGPEGDLEAFAAGGRGRSEDSGRIPSPSHLPPRHCRSPTVSARCSSPSDYDNSPSLRRAPLPSAPPRCLSSETASSRSSWPPSPKALPPPASPTLAPSRATGASSQRKWSAAFGRTEAYHVAEDGGR